MLNKRKRKKPNYDLKAKAIESGMLNTNIFLNKELRRHYATGNIDAYTETLKKMSNLSIDPLWDEADKLRRAGSGRYNRGKKRIKQMEVLEKNIKGSWLIFITITFTNKQLETTNITTRRKYIQRYLNKIAIDYYLNIDFGEKKEREHYHGVVLLKNKINFYDWRKIAKVEKQPYKKINTVTSPNESSPHFTKYNHDEKSASKISQYCNKLNNKAIINTRKQNRCLTKRLTQEVKDLLKKFDI